MNLAVELAEDLLQIKAIKLNPQNPFTWASGIKSPIYCDNRLVLSYPDIRSKVIEGFFTASDNFDNFDLIAGVATAGIPHGALLAHLAQKPFAYIRSSAKKHGRQNKVEGKIEKSAKVLVIEDLISTGGSCLDAVETIRAVGAEVVGVLAIFTYGFEKASKSFEEANCSFSTLTDYQTLIPAALNKNYITKAEAETLVEWRKNPENWYQNTNS